MSTGTHTSGSGIQLTGSVTPAQSEILSEGALNLVASLAHQFEARRQELLARRILRQQDIDQGRYPDFLPETASIRAAEWTLSPRPRRPAPSLRRNHKQDDRGFPIRRSMQFGYT
jgi:malate synthase